MTAEALISGLLEILARNKANHTPPTTPKEKAFERGVECILDPIRDLLVKAGVDVSHTYTDS